LAGAGTAGSLDDEWAKFSAVCTTMAVSDEMMD
jgi:hypothetical protein